MLFLILLLILIPFKQWKSKFSLLFSFVFSFLFGLLFIFYGHFIPKLDIIKFLIPFIIFLLAIFTFLSVKNDSGNKEKVILSFAILFGFFNGIGVFSDVIFQIASNESEIASILKVVFGTGIAAVLLFLAIVVIGAFLKKITKLENKTLMVAFSFLICCLTLPLIFKEIFN